MTQGKSERLAYIDVIRGIAIVIMVAANSAPYIMEEPYPFWFRVVSSFAAPLFIALSGYMMGLNSEKQKTLKVLMRGALILLVGALIDIFIWDLLPFVSYDVLYLIGICVILYPLVLLMNRVQTLIVIILIFTVSFFAQYLFDYQIRSTAIPFEWSNFKLIISQSRFLLFDGWFPFFPWAGLFLLGHFAGKYTILLKRRQKIMILGIAFVLLAGVLFVLFLQNRPTREGYCELFYPADIFYCLSSVFVLILFGITYNLFNHKVWVPIGWLGRSSLFFYVLHLVIIGYFLEKLFLLFGENLFVTFILFYVFVFVVGYLLSKFKQTSLWRKFPYLLRFLLGS